MNSSGSAAGNPTGGDFQSLRQLNYNATLSSVTQVHDDLRIMRVIPDRPFPPFQAGQYVALGLGDWEPRIEGVDEEQLDPAKKRHLIRRAYSISCSLLDSAGKLVRASDSPYLEFYVSLVRHAATRPPALTPRLFALREGDRLFVDGEAKGSYTLEGVLPSDTVLFLATGTGEAPHNAMLAELLVRSHQGPIINMVSVRLRQDAAYRNAHEELAKKYKNYQYFVVTTREPENVNPDHPQFVGKRYLQGLFASGDLERMAGLSLDATRTQVFLCGSPAMIGWHKGSIAAGGMLDVLAKRGFVLDAPHVRGNVHREQYW